jgi:hypothetical protein
MRTLHAAYDPHAACPITFVSMTQRVLMHAAALVQPLMKFNGVLPRSPHWLPGHMPCLATCLGTGLTGIQRPDMATITCAHKKSPSA